MYSISINQLIFRPVIRDDRPHEFLNKMTDDEINIWEREVEAILEKEGIPQIFPEWNAAFLAKSIDRDILYKLIKNGSVPTTKTH